MTFLDTTASESAAAHDGICDRETLLPKSPSVSNPNSKPKPKSKSIYPTLPPPSPARLAASLNDKPLDTTALTSSVAAAKEKNGETILYLAYGSNLCNETFRGRRGIKPISQINVLVPGLKLTFDLPGVPYAEPCFANAGIRNADAVGKVQDDDTEKSSSQSPVVSKGGYRKDSWHKGMVGCVYEVTPTDYAHIIATEGGGSSYSDILIEAYPLPADADTTVPQIPTTTPFLTHTLFAPLNNKHRLSRPDPAYAQSSARYLALLTTGAEELGLPLEYREYLARIRPYQMTSAMQMLGKISFLAVWAPFVLLVFGMQRVWKDDSGRSPKWLNTLAGWLFKGMWTSYDNVWKRRFGDGERTVGDEVDLDVADGVEVAERIRERKRRWDLVRGSVAEKEGLLV